MNYCSQCGFKVGIEDKFCGNCGVSITRFDASAEPIMSTPRSATTGSKPNGTEYFCVSYNKLLILSILTLGIYLMYWCYRNWKAIKVQEHEHLHPLWRAWLANIYNYSLFKRVLNAAEKQGYKDTYGAETLYATHLIGAVLLYTKDIVLVLVGFIIYLFPIYIIQGAIKFNNSKINPESYKRNPHYTPREVTVR